MKKNTKSSLWRVVTYALLAIVVACIGLAGASALATSDSRATYTIDRPANYVTFNSITNNPVHGDERNFVLVREAGRGSFVDRITVHPGKVYEVYVYVANNARADLNASGRGLAADVRLAVEQPATIEANASVQVKAIISASNARPATVWDDAILTANQSVAMRYVTSSAVMHSNGPSDAQLLPEVLFSVDGTLVGYDALNGTLPGGSQYAGYVLYQVAVELAAAEDAMPAVVESLELPKTGVEQVVGMVIGLILLTMGVAYYIKSRSDLTQSLLAAHGDVDASDSVNDEVAVSDKTKR